jgi:hypothetical protein
MFKYCLIAFTIVMNIVVLRHDKNATPERLHHLNPAG